MNNYINGQWFLHYYCFSEPCCGTHVLNTSDIVDFCITNYKSLGRSTASLTAVTREKAVLAHKNGKILLEKVEKLQEKSFDNVDEVTKFIKNLKDIYCIILLF